MRLPTTLALLMATLAPIVSAKDSRTFAVLHFHGDGPLTQGRSDPIVNPGVMALHVHTIHGGNAFGNSATGESMLESTCSTADIAADKSAYWMPSLYFHDANNGSFEPVPLFYMNVYYFFEATNDNITAFPVGLQMFSGDPDKKTAPATGSNVLDPADGTIQPAQFTCPRSSFDPPSYPVGSNGSMAGIQDTGNKGSGAGFPFAECDGYASPLRADLHFPSCYNPEAGLTSFRTNMQFPTDTGDGKQDCPTGWVHTPHLFFEMYWNTPLFVGRWTPNDGTQPFVLSNGDATGFSLHGDFLAAWDTDVLQHIIDTCDAGDSGMDKCPGVETVLKGDCSISNPTPEEIGGSLAALPGDNPVFGWQYGTGSDTKANSTTAKSTAVTTVAAIVSSSSSSSSSAASAASTSASTSAAFATFTSSVSSSSSATFSSPTSTSSSSTTPTSAASASSASTPTSSAATFSASLSSSITFSNASTTSTIFIVVGPETSRTLPTFATHHHFTNTSSPAAATSNEKHHSQKSSGCRSQPTTTVTYTFTPTTTLTTTVHQTTTTTGTHTPSGSLLKARQEHVRRHKHLHF